MSIPARLNLRRDLIRRTLVPQVLLERRVEIYNVNPVASFTAEVVGLLVEVTDTSTDSDGTIVVWDWDWGDGSAHGTTQNASRTYASGGSKTITLTVTDSGGAQHETAQAVTARDVPTDGPGRVYLPANAQDWVDLGLVAPAYQWNLQDTSGGPVAAIGAKNLTTANSGHLYDQAVAGWTAKFLGFADGADGSFYSTDAVFDIATDESVCWLAYLGFVTATLGRTVLVPGNAIQIECGTAGLNTVRGRFGGGATEGTAAYTSQNTVRPFLLGRNCSTLAARLFTSLEQINPVYSGITSTGDHGFGGLGGFAPTMRVCRLAMWRGADAETILAKTTLQTLRWSLPY